MNTGIAYSRADAEADTPTGTHVVDDGEQYAIDRKAERYAVCRCPDDRHQTGREPFELWGKTQTQAIARREGGHVAVEYGYFFVGTVTA